MSIEFVHDALGVPLSSQDREVRNRDAGAAAFVAEKIQRAECAGVHCRLAGWLAGQKLKRSTDRRVDGRTFTVFSSSRGPNNQRKGFQEKGGPEKRGAPAAAIKAVTGTARGVGGSGSGSGSGSSCCCNGHFAGRCLCLPQQWQWLCRPPTPASSLINSHSSSLLAHLPPTSATPRS